MSQLVVKSIKLIEKLMKMVKLEWQYVNKASTVIHKLVNCIQCTQNMNMMLITTVVI